MELHHLRVLREIARQGSLSAAADALAYTQSAVSRQLAQLERQTGERLVVRSRAGTRLTAAGTTLLGHADAILERVDRAEADLRAIGQTRRHELRIAAFDAALATFVPRSARATERQHPETRIAFLVAEPGVSDELLSDGAVDIAITLVRNDVSRDPAARHGLTITDLLHEELLCAMPAEHPHAADQTVDLRDLADAPWALSDDDDCPLYSDFTIATTAAGFAPRRAFGIADIPARLGLVAAGAALTIVPALMVEQPPPGIVVRPFRQPLAIPVVALTVGRPEPPLRTFVQALRAHSARAERAA